jgi:hypothetical protein
MPRPPNDNKRRRPTNSQKRTSQVNNKRRPNVVDFPVANARQAEASATRYLPEIQQALDTTISLTPLQLLAMILKAKLGDRIEDEEVHRICQVFYTGLSIIWGEDEE